MIQEINEAIKADVLLDPYHTNKEDLMDNVKNKGSLGHNDHVIIVFNTLREIRRTKKKIATLDYKRADPLAYSGIYLAAPTGTQATWLIFRDNLLKAQTWFVLTCRKLKKHGRRPVQIIREALSETAC